MCLLQCDRFTVFCSIFIQFFSFILHLQNVKCLTSFHNIKSPKTCCYANLQAQIKRHLLSLNPHLRGKEIICSNRRENIRFCKLLQLGPRGCNFCRPFQTMYKAQYHQLTVEPVFISHIALIQTCPNT